MAKTKDGEVATYSYGASAGKGFENQTRDDIKTPMILVLQSLSPQVTKKTVEGAEPGLLFNNVTEELAEKILFVPATTNQVYIEWVPRKMGGGFVAIHEPTSDLVREALSKRVQGEKLMWGDNELVQTFQIWGVVCDDKQALGFAMIPCSSTKISAYRTWNSKVRQYTQLPPGGTVKEVPPMFAHLTEVSTFFDTSYADGDFHALVLQPANGKVNNSTLAPDDPRFLAGQECYDLSELNQLKPGAYEQASAEATGDTDPPF